MQSDLMMTIEQLLAKYTSLKYNNNKTRIVCEWTGHEMPVNASSILSYVNGNKYKQIMSKNIDSFKLKEMSEFLVPPKHPKRLNQLFCKLTLKHVNKQPDHIQKHLNGKRFQKAYNHWIYCKENGMKFIPISKQQEAKNNEEAASDVESNVSEDSMTDLFPNELLDLVKEDRNESDYEKMSDHQEEMDIDEEKGNKKRKLDSKLNKKHKIEPKQKKNVKSK
ncbi:surfeit locus 2 [Brachionus plicatilis]|uniref:Surfeit locus 2 n=1 Tax=Brachionus plicatilis TaxID=10195 RepID=A0A3M7SHM0_BRAPC|nr:surfeit locus 2 [Brachionus plicatilis]